MKYASATAKRLCHADGTDRTTRLQQRFQARQQSGKYDMAALSAFDDDPNIGPLHPATMRKAKIRSDTR